MTLDDLWRDPALSLARLSVAHEEGYDLGRHEALADASALVQARVPSLSGAILAADILVLPLSMAELVG